MKKIWETEWNSGAYLSAYVLLPGPADRDFVMEELIQRSDNESVQIQSYASTLGQGLDSRHVRRMKRRRQQVPVDVSRPCPRLDLEHTVADHSFQNGPVFSRQSWIVGMDSDLFGYLVEMSSQDARGSDKRDLSVLAVDFVRIAEQKKMDDVWNWRSTSDGSLYSLKFIPGLLEENEDDHDQHGWD